MEYMKIALKSIVGGFLIGIGGTAFLSVDDKIIGAFLFSVGLLSICTTGQFLYTGKVSYIKNVLHLIIILLGNIFGAALNGILILEFKPDLIPRTSAMCQSKLSEGWHVIILGFLCNILIYFAVEGYNNGINILLILCVMSFILCGFEHSIANVFYFTVGGVGIFNSYILMNILGNTLGGITVQIIGKYSKGVA